MKRSFLMLMLLLGLTLGCWKDHVALLASTGEPVRVYPYRLETLPVKDQQDLKKGIPIGSQQELRRLLEDLLS